MMAKKKKQPVRPEETVDDNRFSIETVGDIGELPLSRRANTGDLVEDTGTGNESRTPEVDFDKNTDATGGKPAGTGPSAGFTGGSGILGKPLSAQDEALTAEEIFSRKEAEKEKKSGRDAAQPIITAATGIDPSEKQVKNREAALSEFRKRHPLAEGRTQPGETGEDNGGDLGNQGRDIGSKTQATADLEGFSRDIGISALSPAEAVGGGVRKGDMGRDHNAGGTRGNLGPNRGGFAPGSKEKVELAEAFSGFVYPVSKERVMEKVSPFAEFRSVDGIRINLREAVGKSRQNRFHHVDDLISLIEDELRKEEESLRI